MRILSLLIFCIFLLNVNQKPDSPHGTGFKISCKNCHSPKGWQFDKEAYSFDHNTTKLPLVGQHKVVTCRQCHVSLKFSEAKTNCSECHKDVHQATTGLGCSRCHTPASWLVNNITEIHLRSRFPLMGAHRTADCFQCHKSESLARFDVPGVNCIDCHRSNFIATTNPNHMQSGFSEDCTICHHLNAFQWDGAGFNHSTFPLVQAHSNVKCADCHLTAKFTDAKPDCYSCHQQNYNSTTNPNHAAVGFPQSCGSCHSLTPGWKPAVFNHTKFPLTLGHSGPACLDCHTGGNYTTTPTECYSCHQQNYTSTTNPNHVAAGFPQTCSTCHTTAPGWKPATFNHTVFPLTQAHSSVACADCHIAGNYTTVPTDCYACHQQDYTATTTPNHVTVGFPQTCGTCHTLVPGWKPATYNHTGFPLTLGHSTPSCADCHQGNYTTTSAACYSCHQADYNSTTNPNHTILSFSTTCSQCHTTKPGWKPAAYTQHDSQFFPIYTGRHQGQWSACTDCHTNASNYNLFNCIICHGNTHGKNYTSAQCYNCHPRGVSD